MKKLLILISTILLMSSCADEKTFLINGQSVTVEPCGWFDMDQKLDYVNYQINTGNMVWSIFLSETIFVPILLTGTSLWEPVSLNYEYYKRTELNQNKDNFNLPHHE